ncbi:PepSY-associated TM helix domain-containing protein [Sandarakinorhabdus sp. DWP1-3-1]|uniref:PepSY-associated TM helix domain-containing protein n=1 Tax=Sandarakinorhabdus sp. DWP1-3-1 TaxID=2804627 RepID=UPI003CE8BF8F
MRRALVLWHRWFGLAAALWLLVLALTGTIIVFQDELDRALNPDLRSVAIGGPMASAETLKRAAEAAEPGSALDYLMLPVHPGDSALAFAAPRDAGVTGHVFRQTYLDPHDGRLLGRRVFGEMGLDRRRIVSFIYQLHIDLMLGATATWLAGLLALLWTFDHIAAAILAFPNLRRWRESLHIRWAARGHRRTFDLHRAIGLWLFPVTLVLAISGLSLTWHEDFDAAVSVVSPTMKMPPETLPLLAKRDFVPATSLDQAIAVARARAGGAPVVAVSLHPDRGAYWLRLADARDIGAGPGRWILVRYSDGAVLADRHVATGSAGDMFTAWLFPLHSGAAFGWPGRLLVAASGMALCAVIITGLLIWSRKRRSANWRALRVGRAAILGR